MITVAIIAVIAAIAYPSYQDSVRRSRRADAKTALMNAAQMLERCFTERNVYNHASCPTIPSTSENGHYAITTPTLIDNAFIVRATPQGAQLTRDGTYCATFSINEKLDKEATGTDSANCWK